MLLLLANLPIKTCSAESKGVNSEDTTASSSGQSDAPCLASGLSQHGSPLSRLRKNMADKSNLLCRNSDRLDNHGLMTALGSRGNVASRKGLRASRARQSHSALIREPIASITCCVSLYASATASVLVCLVCITLEPQKPVSLIPVPRCVQTPLLFSLDLTCTH